MTATFEMPQKPSVSSYVNWGVLCAIIGLFVFPEIFCSAAIVLGAYAWRLDCNEQTKRGLWVLIVGIVAMLIGLYYTSIVGLYDFLP